MACNQQIWWPRNVEKIWGRPTVRRRDPCQPELRRLRQLRRRRGGMHNNNIKNFDFRCMEAGMWTKMDSVGGSGCVSSTEARSATPGLSTFPCIIVSSDRYR